MPFIKKKKKFRISLIFDHLNFNLTINEIIIYD